MWILWLLIWLVVPIVGLVVIIRAIAGAAGHDKHGKREAISDRDFIIAFLAAPAVVAGFGGINYLAENIGPAQEEDAISFIIKILAGVLLLVAGITLSGITGKIQMILAIILLFMAMPFAFESLGDAGAFLAILVAFILLIMTVLWLNKREKKTV